jgi:uncharacterized protein DUF1775
VAGITRLEIQADPPISAGAVTIVQGPPVWKVVPGPGGGFAVEGPALQPGVDADVQLRVRELPNASQVVLRILQSYADGTVERWTELPGPDGAEPERPAVILRLTGATAAPGPSASVPAAPSPSPSGAAPPAQEHSMAPAASPSPPPAASQSPAAGGGAAGFPWIPAVLAAVVLPLAVLIFALGRRRTPPKDGDDAPDDFGGTPA